MTDQELLALVQEISLICFDKPFRHRARFNSRLSSTAGRYKQQDHSIELNPRYYHTHGGKELANVIKHELCHYHLAVEQKPYNHRAKAFKDLLAQVNAPRYAKPASAGSGYRYLYKCTTCGMLFPRRRKINTTRYVCGCCRNRLELCKEKPGG